MNAGSTDVVGSDIAVDENDNLYVVGYVAQITPTDDIWIGKFDTNLVRQSSAAFDGGGRDRGFNIAIDTVSAVLYVLGMLDQLGADDGWIGKYDYNLVLLSSTTIPEVVVLPGIAVKPGGDVFVTGSVDPGGDSDILLARYDSDLVLQSSTVISSPYHDVGIDIAFDQNGNIFVSGGDNEFIDNKIESFIWIGKFDDNLILQSTVTFFDPGSPAASGITTDEAGNVFTTGRVTSDASPFQGAVWVAKLNNNLVLLSSVTIEHQEISGGNIGRDIILDETGKVFVSGSAIFLTEIGGNENGQWVGEFDNNLTLISSETLHTPESFGPGGITLDSTGDVFVTGTTSLSFFGRLGLWRFGLGPGPVNGFSAQVLGISSIAWSWDSVVDAAGYRVVDSADANLSGDLPASAVSWTETGLSANAAHTRRVVAFNGSEVSTSAAATVYTLADDVTGLAITGVSENTVSLSWNVNTNPAGTSYEVHQDSGSGFAQIASTTASTHMATGLTALNTYYYKVRAINGDAIPTGFSNTVTTTTLPPQPVQALFTTPPRCLILGTTMQVSAVPAYIDVEIADASGNILASTWAFHTVLINSQDSDNTRGGIDPSQPIQDGGSWPFIGPSNSSLPVIIVPGQTRARFWIWDTTAGTTTIKAQVVRQDGLNFTLVTQAQCVTPLGAPTGFAGAMQSPTSILWTWSDNSTLEGGYRVMAGAANQSGDLPAGTTSWLQTGLSSNTLVGPLNSRVFRDAGTEDSNADSVWTLAAPPLGSAASAVYETSATVSWGLNGNPAATYAEVERSTDNLSFFQVAAGSVTSFTNFNLLSCSTYYFRVRNVGGGGGATAYDATVTVITLAKAPGPPSGLSAQSLSGRQILLNWTPSITPGIDEYRLYYDSGSAPIDYGTPLAVVASSMTSFITAPLTSGTSYQFAMRAVCCGLEEQNTTVKAAATALTSITGVRARIKVPFSGKKIAGNRVLIMAELTSGDPFQTKEILFEYKASSASVWTPVVSANVEHPNPDMQSPYFVHWDVTGSDIEPTGYDLRAVAKDISDVVDPAPEAISITVESQANADTVETSLGGGRIQKDEKVHNTITNKVESSDEGTSQTTRITIPAGALSESSVTVRVVNRPAVPPADPTDLDPIGVVTEITLRNGQTLLANSQTATVAITYPDTNDDGIVDGTTVRASDLRMYTYDTVLTKWVQDFASVVNLESHTVTGNTPHFSFFALFGVPATTAIIDVRVYPNPFRPNDGNPDTGVGFSAGNAASGITFDQLPTEATIKIYTITGQRVAQFTAVGAATTIQWDARNDRGDDVASGPYLTVIGSPGQQPTVRKILVIR